MQDSTHFIWNYEPTGTIITKDTCPDYTDQNTTVNLPDTENLVFTKQ